MPAFDLSGDRHQQRPCAASEIGHVEGGWELVISPVNMRRPVVKHQPCQQGGSGHRSVVSAGELGVGQQRVEQPPGQIMPFQPARVLHSLYQGSDDRGLDFVWPIFENVKDVGG